MGSFKFKLVAWFALLALLPVAVAFYGYGRLAVRSESRRADAGLEAGLRAAVAGYSARLDAASAVAARLARDPAVQRALRDRDRAALEAIAAERPHTTLHAGPIHAGAADGLAAARSVTVLAHGRLVGSVRVAVPVDEQLLRRLSTGLGRGDRLAAVRFGRAVAGIGARQLRVRPGDPSHVEVGGVTYRGLATEPLPDPPGLELVALTPQGAIDAAARSNEERVGAALAASLLVFALVIFLVGRSVVGTLRRLADAADALAQGRLDERVDVRGRDEFAQLGRAFNHMAGQLQQRLAELEAERLRVREATARFGAALAATHDADQLMQVVAESAVEATGATGGIVLSGAGELARAGDPDAGAERIAFPLRGRSSDFGSLVVSSPGFNAEEVDAAASLAAQAVVALENARLHGIVRQQALVDELTGLANRRSLEETLRAELARGARFDISSCLVLADLDWFKRVNDEHGHPVGDEVLREFARTLKESLRETDVAARFGGEEFALVLAGTDAEGGAQLAERTRARFAARSIATPNGDSLSVTASFGVAAYPDYRDLDALLAAADSALYAAKRAGRNQVMVAESVQR